jgi:hypothetical protein
VTDNIPRCKRCRYALINGVCPICQGRAWPTPGYNRTPLLAPLPKPPEQPESTARVLRFKRRRRP